MKIGHFLSAEACAPEQFTRWGGLGRGSSPTLNALTANKVRSLPLLSMSKLLTSVAPHGVGNIQANRKPLITDMEVCRQRRHFECQTVCGGNGLLSFFPINLYAREINWSASADWISSDIPSSESVRMTAREEFNDACLSRCTGCSPRRVAFTRTSACFSFHASTRSGPFFRREALVTFPAMLSRTFRIWNRLMFFIILSESLRRNVTKRGAGSFTGTPFRDETELNSGLSGEEDSGLERAILKRSPIRNRQRQPTTAGGERMKDIEVYRSASEWGPPPRPDLRNYVRGVIYGQSPTITKPNGKYCTIGGLQLCVPTMRIAAHGPPLYTMQTGWGLHGLRELVVGYIAAPSQR
jgi:hypothetical protein